MGKYMNIFLWEIVWILNSNILFFSDAASKEKEKSEPADKDAKKKAE